MKLRVNRDPFDLSSPRIRVVCNIETVAIIVDKTQYQSCLFLSSSMEAQRKRDRYRRYRPRNVSVLQDPKAWWLYAINAVNSDLKEERRR